MREDRQISAETARKYIDYDPETGVFTREGFPLSESYKKRRNVTERQIGGRPTGHVRPDGYVEISVKGKLFLAHRLAWLIMTGAWPEQQIDHKDAVRGNNQFSNLREATPTQNQGNRGVNKTSITGIKCVRKKGRNTWEAYIRIKELNTSVVIGRFDSPDAASAAYMEAAKKLYGEFARAA